MGEDKGEGENSTGEDKDCVSVDAAGDRNGRSGGVWCGGCGGLRVED
jgi:hypothetical protein